MKKRATKQIFVTGFPTFLTIKLVQTLAGRLRSGRLHVLVMEKHLPLARQLLKRLTPGAKKRVSLYVGDTTSIDLGLSGEEYNRLTGKITHIYHAAAIWQYGVPQDICETVTVGGARNVLEFAAECKQLAKVAFFSTIHVSGKKRGVILESDFSSEFGFKNATEQAHFSAERLARERSEAGLPITVFRVGNIVGDSETGEIMNFEGPYQFVEILLTLDKNLPLFLPGACEGPSNLAPVDYLVESCLHLFAKSESTGKTYHLTDPFPLATRGVFEAVCNYIGRKPPTFGIPRRLYKMAFWIPGMERASGVPVDLYDYFNHRAVHNCSNTLEDLKGSGINCPRFESYFPIGVEYARDLLRRRMEKAEEEQTIDPLDGLLA